MRSATFACFLLVIALPLAAFDPEEHRNLSNEALEAAARDVAGGEMRSAASAFLSEESKAGGHSFGDVTRAVDWFTDPDNLFDAEKYTVALDGRRRNVVLRGYAVYRNSTHFQRRALDKWSEHHEKAIEHAKANRHAEALLREAIALHYLQDFFSAGHVVTPRAKMHSSVAGMLHDRYNERGIPFESATDGKVQFHGDGTLETDTQQKQRGFVLRMSRLSIDEVLTARAGVEPEKQLQACFQNRTEKRVNGALLEITPPVGAIRRTKPDKRVLPRCEGDGWEGIYRTKDVWDEVAKVNPLTQTMYDLSGIMVRGDAGIGRRDRELRANVDVLFPIFAEPPDDDVVDAETLKPVRSTGNLQAGAVGFSYLRSDKYNAAGLVYDYGFATRVESLTWGVKGSLRRYGYGDTHPWRTDIGLRGGFGLQVVNIIAAVERSHHIAADGRFRAEYFFTVGVDGYLPWSWVDRYVVPW